MLTVGGGAMAVLLLFVLPRFVALLQDAGSTLPRSTAVLISVSQLFTRGLPFIAAAGAALVAAYTMSRSSESGRERMDAFLLRLPLLGSLRSRHATARLANTLATLLAGGVPLLSALEIAHETTGDAAIGADLRTARDAVRRGEALSTALGRGRAFPYAFVRLVEVGEETGRLETLIEKAGALLETELERRLERSVALVEPAMIVVFGCVIGFVALALLQAIYGIHAEGF
jgi:type II secretory pathway component PulF